jgi:hypothetical protein
MDRATVILGAGASVPYFDPRLSTDALTASIRDKGRWADLIARYSQISDGVNEVDERVIFSLLDSLDIYAAGLNFEDIIEVVDKISSYGFGASTPKPSHILIRILKGILPNHSLHTWSTVPFLFRQLIAERIGEYHRDHQVQDYQAKVEGLGDFLLALMADRTVSAVSFNYDSVLFDAIASKNLSIENGFNGDVFSPAVFLHGGSVVSFPHGNARFIMEDEHVRSLLTIGEANQCRMDHLVSGTSRTTYFLEGSNSYHFNTFIVSGRDKDDSFNTNPFAAYYQRLAVDLLKSKKVIIAGYSFGDLHVNRLLVNYLTISSGNKIFVVTYDPDKIDMLEEFKDSTSLVHALLMNFNIHGIPLQGNLASHTYGWASEVAKINSTGYGILYPQIVFCKTGFTRFLQDFHVIFSL